MPFFTKLKLQRYGSWSDFASTGTFRHFMARSSSPSIKSLFLVLHHEHINETESLVKMAGRVRKKFQMTHFIIPNKIFSIKFAPKSVPGLPEVGVPHGDEDGPRAPPKWLERVRKKLQMTHFTMPNNIF